MGNAVGLFCRQFAPEVEAIAEVWSTASLSTDEWQATGRTWGTNSHPFEVSNLNNLRGVAKPGPTRPADRVLCAANEKIVSDLAFVVGLPIPPVTIWDRGEGGAGERFVSISAWAFRNAVEWPSAVGALSADQLTMACDASAAMRVFDTWVAAQDRRDDHLLVSDDSDQSGLRLAYIDYAFAASYEWANGQATPENPRNHFPQAATPNPDVTPTAVELISTVTDLQIAEIVNRIPTQCFFDGAREAVIAGLIERRDRLRVTFTS